MSSNAWQQQLQQHQARSTAQIHGWLDRQVFCDNPLIQAMRYGATLGGKRVRPFLVYEVGALFNAPVDALDTPATAIEMIHAYSLIHDDLPAMDDDALRRGQPTCHIQFDEAHAILAGDALQTLAFEVMATGPLSQQGEANRVAMLATLAQASGANGMCIGQALDLQAEGQHADLAQLETIHRHKTGALIMAAVRMGALAGGCNNATVLQQLDIFARNIGLAFQVQDDILDLISDTQTLGKPQGSDVAHNKSTYPALLGLEGAQQKARDCYQNAISALASLPYQTDTLEKFAQYIIERNH
ncbi:(2E,6E)-farnesyl diphosphate synthase [Vibrio stylophorae]